MLMCEAQVKEVLQKYLDDEDDLKDLHLSARSALILSVPTSFPVSVWLVAIATINAMPAYRLRVLIGLYVPMHECTNWERAHL